MYIIHKCGIKLNPEEADINNCPVCEDVKVQASREVNVSSQTQLKRWRESQRKHRQKEHSYYLGKFV